MCPFRQLDFTDLFHLFLRSAFSCVQMIKVIKNKITTKKSSPGGVDGWMGDGT